MLICFRVNFFLHTGQVLNSLSSIFIYQTLTCYRIKHLQQYSRLGKSQLPSAAMVFFTVQSTTSALAIYYGLATAFAIEHVVLILTVHETAEAIDPFSSYCALPTEFRMSVLLRGIAHRAGLPRV